MAEINRYNNSKIYKICSNLTDKFYIGSTTQTLAQRLSKHTNNYKHYLKNNNTHYMTSYEIIKYGDFYITLIEECNFNNRQQLFKREGEIMKLNNNNIVNKLIAGRTDKEYYNDNKDKINKEYQKEYHKEYHIKNAEHIAERAKKIYNDNKEILVEKQKQYYLNNKEKIAEQRKETFTCNCGSILRVSDKTKHNKSKKHINLSYLNELTFYNL